MMESRLVLVAIFLLTTVQIGVAQIKLDLSTLEGKWHIIQTDFPMWLKGNKTAPTFNYGLLDRKELVLSDRVTFLKNGKEKSIRGFDRPVDAEQTAFIWRGKGFLSLLKSKWNILHLDSEHYWAIIYFERTLFTPEGYDVIAREKDLDQSQLESIELKLKALGISGKLKHLR